MNTPKSSEPKRFGPQHGRSQDKNLYQWPIPHFYTLRLGRIVIAWFQVEQAAIDLFQLILKCDPPSAPIAFRAIISTEARIGAMKSVLEKSPTHSQTPKVFDQLVSEYDSLNAIRNKLVHWRWSHHLESDNCFIQRDRGDFIPDSTGEERITLDDLDDIYVRMRAFQYDVDAERNSDTDTLGFPDRAELSRLSVAKELDQLPGAETRVRHPRYRHPPIEWWQNLAGRGAHPQSDP